MPGAKAFVDFQNDVTANDLALAAREGFRSIEHVKRYTTAGMATDQGKTSNLNALGIVARQLGKRVPEVGLTDVPDAVYTGDLRGARGHGAWRAVRPGAQDADARMGGRAWRGVRRCRAVEARAVLSARGRGHACRGRARMPGGAHRLRDLRRLDTRQGRGGRPRCGRVPESPVHQQLVEPRGRPRALRNPAARGRIHLRRRRDRAHGRGSIPRDDDDRRRGARTQHDGGLPPDGMAGPRRVADVDHRAMGGHRRAGPARAARARAARHRHRHLAEWHCRTWAWPTAGSAASR